MRAPLLLLGLMLLGGCREVAKDNEEVSVQSLPMPSPNELPSRRTGGIKDVLEVEQALASR